MKILSRASAKKEDRNSYGFHILHCYWSFSSDIKAVKGLKTGTECIIHTSADVMVFGAVEDRD